MSESKREEALDLLLDRRADAAPSILRLGIGSSATEPYDLMLSIQPTDPGGPTAPPNYTWNGWDGGQVWFSRHLDLFTGHGYASAATRPLPTTATTWMSEWAPSSVADGWNEAWDSGRGTDGLAVALRIHDTLALANSSAFIFWLGSSRGGTAALMQIDDANDAYRVSSRLWAFAAYSRFIRPGAERIGVNGAPKGLKVSAYRNADGTEVVEIIDTGTEAVTTEVDMRRPTAYLTDSAHNLEKAPRLG